jgi:23S rRNA (guanosine2251-2'-O)-methyltransferase
MTVRSRPPSARTGRPSGARPRSNARERLVGVHPAREALRARRRVLHGLRVRTSEGALRPDLLALVEEARAAGVPVEELAGDRFDREAPRGLPHQGVVLEAGPLPEVSLAELVPAEGAPAWLVALDGIEDPQNLGAILRVALAAGVQGVLLPERRAAPLSPAVGRASAGALEHLPVCHVTNLARALNHLKSKDFWVHGAEPEADRDLFQTPDRLFDGRLVLVLGAEGRGLRPGVRAAIDVHYRIPMEGAIASLNVATAAAVVLFEWRRRRNASRGRT